MMSPTNLANNVLKRSFESKNLITPMKLQKLLYFIYKEYLCEQDKRLFIEPFRAWRYGPVLLSVYSEFSQFGAKPITKFAKDSSGDAFLVNESPQLTATIEKIWNKYRLYSGIDLSKITHQEDTAWDKAINRGDEILTDEDIKNEQPC